jgi:hypothetical protein
MITEHRGCHRASSGDIEIDLTVSVTQDEATAVTWYAGNPVEVALQRMIKDRITRAVDAHHRSEAGYEGSPVRY